MTDKIRLAVDIGGTFTDLALEGPFGRRSHKLLTTPDSPERAVIEGITKILPTAQVKPEDVSIVIHGTTLATNAIIERKGAKTGLLTTAGFRDSIEMAYEHRFDQYDLYMERPPVLAPRHRRLEAEERVASDGSILLPLKEASLHSAIEIFKAEEVEAVAITFLHSYVNPTHELRAGEILAEALPNVAITLSHQVCPEIREYERTSTALANAYVQPLMAGYLQRLAEGLKQARVKCPLLMMTSAGGVVTVETAVAEPVRLVESGPAGGAILATRIAQENNESRALAFDMGGTTAKLTLIDDMSPQYARSFEVARAHRFLKGSGLPLRIPVIDMVEIGAGGGSIARLDNLKRISVGPDSAGASPGPVAYGKGGVQPTVTDADVIMGRINPAHFAGGRIKIDAVSAEAAVSQDIAEELQIQVITAAAGIGEIVDENMANAARVHAVENGKDTEGRTMIAFGGAAPIHAARLADKLGISRVIIPKGAGVGSAFGFLAAPIAYEVARSRLIELMNFDYQVLSDLFDEMRAEAEAVVRLGAPSAHLIERRVAYMRYRGQGHEIAVNMPNGNYGPEDAQTLTQAFEREYSLLFGRIIPNLEVEAITFTLALGTEPPVVNKLAPPQKITTPKSENQRNVFDPGTGASHVAQCYDRTELAVGSRLRGPALILEDETTTVVPPGFTAEINSGEHILLTREPHR
ncbi:MAG: hydantoinase/oxoprolinase family protein [Rhodospirillales bacterium]